MAQGSRRQVLAVGTALAGTALGTGALSACSGGGDNSASSGNNGSTGSKNSGDTGSSGSSTGFELVALDKVPVGGAVSAKDAKGNPLIVARPTQTTAACFSAICTHAGCTVAPAGKQLDCPCHGSVYQATTGKNVSGPAPRPLAKVAVKVTDGKVVTA
jgi:cytochrome b6-f complex iron-sulfur subunit